MKPRLGPYVLVDLDGTVCNTTHRRSLIDKGREGGPDWRSYSLACGDDAVIPGIRALVHILGRSDVEVIYASGRDEAAREPTRGWLIDNRMPPGELLMRPEGNRLKNADLKCDWVDQLGPEWCELAIDDFPEVLTALWNRWRIPGLLVPSNDRRYDTVALERSGVLTDAHLLGS